MIAKAIRIRGIVQGVGFRPFIWHLATQHKLKGSVWNDEQGVMIHVWGEEQNLQEFIQQIPLKLPPLAKLDSLKSHKLNQAIKATDFQIKLSQQQTPAQIPITADATICCDCLAEINNPKNPRYRYPFTNCTHCGARFSITQAMPYDRCHTSMSAFPHCSRCQQEYENPADRRFHAQTNCCPDCEPHIYLENNQAESIVCEDVLSKVVALIQQGAIIAIKGLGGFHLACDATNEQAVAKLRERKHRYAKPLALMAVDVEMVKAYVEVKELEEQALRHKAAPIVLLDLRGFKNLGGLASNIAPNENKLGFMIAYTPLHYLLIQALKKPLVMTSANISDEPQCIDNDDAKVKLSNIADYFLLHNRTIINRLDDSVVRIMDNQTRLLRRARGFSPEALTLPVGFEKVDNVLAMGAELKNSFCIIKQGQAIVSQYIGDLEQASTQQAYRKTLEDYQRLFNFKAEHIAVDLHPNYLSTQYGQQLATEQLLTLTSVQHHHAHIAACMVEYGLTLEAEPVLGVVFDGLGMGLNNELWGGEFLLADYKNFTRLGHFQAIALLGGTQAMREPWRNCYAQLHHYFEWSELEQYYGDLEIMQFLKQQPLDTLNTMLAKSLNSPLSSSCGRWFDAFAFALGLCDKQISYEGQAAIALENLASPVFLNEQHYVDAFECQKINDTQVLSWKSLWKAVLNDLSQGVDKAIIAARIHHSLVMATTELVLILSKQTGTNTIVLSGGVFQNRLLLESVSQRLREHDKTVLSPQLYPTNDGGLALGQAIIAAASLK
ncbi:MAG: carbamoyltransferase HypF [Methylococcaceae bacterium]|nr:carbamoyltransferase HypF [Methylococcaceae bacterium]